MSAIDDVNFEVNTSIIYKADLDHYGVPDYWTIPIRYGDCEDYALLKRKRLLKLGINSTLMICYDENNVKHMVLIVDNKVLDNKRYAIYDMKDLRYKWIMKYENGRWQDMKGKTLPPPSQWLDYCKRSHDCN